MYILLNKSTKKVCGIAEEEIPIFSVQDNGVKILSNMAKGTHFYVNETEYPVKDYLSMTFEEVPETLEADGSWFYLVGGVFSQEEPTDAESVFIQSEDVKSALVREKRNQLLADTDKYMVTDSILDEENLEKVRDYRVLLRDIPEQKGFPFTVAYPVCPV